MILLRSLTVAVVLSVLGVGSTQAAIISYAGYTHNDTTNIVTGGGFEWLQWDVTDGMSVDSALSIYGAAGWGLASNTQMADLFNAFGFGGITWDADETTSQTVFTGSDGDIELPTDPELLFVALFGNTYTEFPNADDPANPLSYSGALYGLDPNNDHYYNLAIVHDDYTDTGGFLPPARQGYAAMTADASLVYSTWDYAGVALVRSPTAVPEPSTWLLMGVGLVGSCVARRRKTKGLTV